MEKDDYAVWCDNNLYQIEYVTNRNTFDIRSILKPDVMFRVTAANLRPAVLADWAKEIPEEPEYKKIWLIRNNKGNVCICYHADSSILWGTPMGDWVADALSAHYGIAIMKEKEYKKYMEGK